MARQASVITHLFFADDNLLFSRENSQEADRIVETLHKYELSLGQMVNLDKSKASFSRNVCEEEKILIWSRMRVKTVTSHSKYLGFPVVLGRSKKEIFA